MKPLPPIKQYKGILFDLFHTLVSLIHAKTPGKNSNEILGISREVWWDALFNKTDDRLRGIITDPVAIIRDITNQIDPGIDDAIIREVAQKRGERFRQGLIHVSPHVIECLRKLSKTHKIGLVSNADVMERAGWEESEISDYFDCAVFSCDVGFVKPQTEIYNCCLAGLGLSTHEVLFVGDGGSDELIGAKKAGITTVFTSEYIKDLAPETVTGRKEIADFHIEHIGQLCLD